MDLDELAHWQIFSSANLDLQACHKINIACYCIKVFKNSLWSLETGVIPILIQQTNPQLLVINITKNKNWRFKSPLYDLAQKFARVKNWRSTWNDTKNWQKLIGSRGLHHLQQDPFLFLLALCGPGLWDPVNLIPDSCLFMSDWLFSRCSWSCFDFKTSSVTALNISSTLMFSLADVSNSLMSICNAKAIFWVLWPSSELQWKKLRLNRLIFVYNFSRLIHTSEDSAVDSCISADRWESFCLCNDAVHCGEYRLLHLCESALTVCHSVPCEWTYR